MKKQAKKTIPPIQNKVNRVTSNENKSKLFLSNFDIVNDKNSLRNDTENSLTKVKEKIDIKINQRLFNLNEELLEKFIISSTKIRKDEIQTQIITLNQSIKELIDIKCRDFYNKLSQLVIKSADGANDSAFNKNHAQVALTGFIDQKLSQIQYSSTNKIEKNIEKSIKNQLINSMHLLKKELISNFQSTIVITYIELSSNINKKIQKKIEEKKKSPYPSCCPEHTIIEREYFLTQKRFFKSSNGKAVPEFSVFSSLQGFLKHEKCFRNTN